MNNDIPIGTKKVVIIGAGNVGASIAYMLAIKCVANDIVLIDKDEERAKCEVLDIRHGFPGMGGKSIRTGSYRECSNCSLICTLFISSIEDIND